MAEPVQDVEGIARRLTKAQRDAWADAEWHDEYYVEPSLPVWERAKMRRLGLLGPENDVTLLGERLIAHLCQRRRSWLKRAWDTLRAHLLSQDSSNDK